MPNLDEAVGIEGFGGAGVFGDGYSKEFLRAGYLFEAGGEGGGDSVFVPGGEFAEGICRELCADDSGAIEHDCGELSCDSEAEGGWDLWGGDGEGGGEVSGYFQVAEHGDCGFCDVVSDFAYIRGGE